MQSTSIPSRFGIAFAASAGSPYIRVIPQPSQISIQNGAASLTDGFPPNTFVPPNAGGVGPFGQDFNGILKQITQWNQWQAAGAASFYDATFSAVSGGIGGYPKNAILANVNTANFFWINTVDNNTANPDTGGANWKGFGIAIAPTYTALSSGSGAFSTPTGATRLKIRMIAGGGGGGGSGNGSGSNGGNGGTTSFSTTTTLGGGAGFTNVSTGQGNGGTGGTGGVTSLGTEILRLHGAGGLSGSSFNTSVNQALGGPGAASCFGGGGAGTLTGGVPGTVPGSGGSGAGGSSSPVGAAGGGACGEFVEFVVNAPSGNYAWVVGAGGNGGAAGPSGFTGGAGGNGVILIEVLYN